MGKLLSTTASLILSVFFMCIVLYYMLCGLNVLETAAGIRALVFAGIGFFILIAVFGFGSLVASRMGTGFYSSLCIVTALYVIVNTVINCTLFLVFKPILFTLLNLAVIFVYAVICIPLFVASLNRPSENRGGINEHNLPNTSTSYNVNNVKNEETTAVSTEMVNVSNDINNN